MAYPTNGQIDAAVPANGTPNRALTNAVLKGITANATLLAEDGTVPLRTVESGPFTGGRIKASPAMDPEDCVTMVQALFRTLTAPANSGADGVMGEFFVDDDYLYICTSLNTWSRFSTTAW